MLPLRNDGAGLTVRMKLNLPVGFPYYCAALFLFSVVRFRSACGESGFELRIDLLL